MHELECPGLPASWVNAWLGGVGATVLDQRIRLHWSTKGTPVAVLSSAELDPVEALVQSWPDKAFLHTLPIAERWNGTGELRRKIPLEQFVARVRAARSHPQAWTLSSTMTDLSVEQNGEIAHAPFDPAGPGTTKWLHDRVLRIHEAGGPMCEERLRRSLLGEGERVKNNGLGFDYTRVGSLTDATTKWVEPTVELLAFFGLATLPMRAQGADRRTSHRIKADERQRGWRKPPGSDERRRFVWAAWRQPLDTAGIDALLDSWNPWRRSTWERFGVHAAWRSVEYQWRGSADTTRGIGAERL